MSFRALFIANAVMLLFVGFTMVQSFNSINSGQLLTEMQNYGLVQPVAAH